MSGHNLSANYWTGKNSKYLFLKELLSESFDNSQTIDNFARSNMK
jgi:hypothetical protein